MSSKHSIVFLVLLVVACGSPSPSVDDKGSNGEGGSGTDNRAEGGAGGVDHAGGQGGDAEERSDAGASGGRIGGSAGATGEGGGSGGQPMSQDAGVPMGGAGGRATLEPPANVVTDWRACEPGGNCPSSCADRPMRAAHKPADFVAKDFRGPVFVPDKDGIVVVEAEDFAYTGNWRKTTTNPETKDNTRFTGGGYLVWQGYTVSGVDEDVDQTHQGNHCDWLVVKVWIRPEDENLYTWAVRTYNVQADGDNDAWHGRIAQTETVRRLVTGHDVNRSFTYTRAPQLNYPAQRLRSGLHAIYVQGRSGGYGIDRIVIHPAGTQAKALALDPARPKSKPFPAGYFPRP